MNAKSILVIDDSPALLELFEDILTGFGYAVITRPTGKDALKFVSDLNPHLVILDMMLDGYDGRDICNTLKQAELVKDIPVIIVSASYRLKDRILGYCNPDAFLEKPFDIDELVLIIENQLAKAG